MRFPRKRLLVKAALALAAVFLIPYFLLSAAASTREFKTFAQSKVSEFLKAEVTIGRIRVAFWNQIILSDLQVNSPGSSDSGIQIRQIAFRYSLTQLLKRDFQIPSSVVLKSPKMVMNPTDLPKGLFEGMNPKSGKNMISNFELAGGEIRYEIPVLKASVFLKDIQAIFSPRSDQRIEVLFRSRLAGIVEGNLEFKGVLDPKSGERNFKGKIHSAKISEALVSAKNSVNADFELQNTRLILKRLVIASKDSKYLFSGEAEGLPSLTKADFSAQVLTPSGNQSFQLSSDFIKKELTGVYIHPDYEMHYSGETFFQDQALFIKNLKTSLGHMINGVADFSNGQASVNIDRAQKRLAADLRIKNSEMELDLKADHVDVAGIDLVTSAKIHFSSESFHPGKWFQLGGNFETDYFVLDTVALDDFKGDFELNPWGITDLSGSWGKVFKVAGNIQLGEKIPEVDLTVRVNGFDIKKVKKFANKPLPKNIGGVLSGKLKIAGRVYKPDVRGRFIIKDGWLDRVDFERAIIQFDGFPPILKLNESKVFRGRGTLLVTGNIDLQAQNFFSGSVFETLDHIVLYRGLDVTLKGEEDDLDMEIHPGIKNLPILGVSAGKSSHQDQDGQSSEAYLEAGPRFRF